MHCAFCLYMTEPQGAMGGMNYAVLAARADAPVAVLAARANAPAAHDMRFAPMSLTSGEVGEPTGDLWGGALRRSDWPTSASRVLRTGAGRTGGRACGACCEVR